MSAGSGSSFTKRARAPILASMQDLPPISTRSQPESPAPSPDALDRRQWVKWAGSLGAALPFLITLAPAEARAQGSS